MLTLLPVLNFLLLRSLFSFSLIFDPSLSPSPSSSPSLSLPLFAGGEGKSNHSMAASSSAASSSNFGPQFRSRFGDTSQTKIFVGGLPWETSSEELHAFFAQFGEILEAVVITDRVTGRSKGYGFVSILLLFLFLLLHDNHFEDVSMILFLLKFSLGSSKMLRVRWIIIFRSEYISTCHFTKILPMYISLVPLDSFSKTFYVFLGALINCSYWV